MSHLYSREPPQPQHRQEYVHLTPLAATTNHFSSNGASAHRRTASSTSRLPHSPVPSSSEARSRKGYLEGQCASISNNSPLMEHGGLYSVSSGGGRGRGSGRSSSSLRTGLPAALMRRSSSSRAAQGTPGAALRCAATTAKGRRSSSAGSSSSPVVSVSLSSPSASVSLTGGSALPAGRSSTANELSQPPHATESLARNAAAMSAREAETIAVADQSEENLQRFIVSSAQRNTTPQRGTSPTAAATGAAAPSTVFDTPLGLPYGVVGSTTPRDAIVAGGTYACTGSLTGGRVGGAQDRSGTEKRARSSLDSYSKGEREHQQPGLGLELCETERRKAYRQPPHISLSRVRDGSSNTRGNEDVGDGVSPLSPASSTTSSLPFAMETPASAAAAMRQQRHSFGGFSSHESHPTTSPSRERDPVREQEDLLHFQEPHLWPRQATQRSSVQPFPLNSSSHVQQSLYTAGAAAADRVGDGDPFRMSSSSASKAAPSLHDPRHIHFHLSPPFTPPLLESSHGRPPPPVNPVTAATQYEQYLQSSIAKFLHTLSERLPDDHLLRQLINLAVAECGHRDVGPSSHVAVSRNAFGTSTGCIIDRLTEVVQEHVRQLGQDQFFEVVGKLNDAEAKVRFLEAEVQRLREPTPPTETGSTCEMMIEAEKVEQEHEKEEQTSRNDKKAGKKVESSGRTRERESRDRSTSPLVPWPCTGVPGESRSDPINPMSEEEAQQELLCILQQVAREGELERSRQCLENTQRIIDVTTTSVRMYQQQQQQQQSTSPDVNKTTGTAAVALHSSTDTAATPSTLPVSLHLSSCALPLSSVHTDPAWLTAPSPDVFHFVSLQRTVQALFAGVDSLLGFVDGSLDSLDALQHDVQQQQQQVDPASRKSDNPPLDITQRVASEERDMLRRILVGLQDAQRWTSSVMDKLELAHLTRSKRLQQMEETCRHYQTVVQEQERALAQWRERSTVPPTSAGGSGSKTGVTVESEASAAVQRTLPTKGSGRNTASNQHSTAPSTAEEAVNPNEVRLLKYDRWQEEVLAYHLSLLTSSCSTTESSAKRHGSHVPLPVPSSSSPLSDFSHVLFAKVELFSHAVATQYDNFVQQHVLLPIQREREVWKNALQNKQREVEAVRQQQQHQEEEVRALHTELSSQQLQWTESEAAWKARWEMEHKAAQKAVAEAVVAVEKAKAAPPPRTSALSEVERLVMKTDTWYCGAQRRKWEFLVRHGYEPTVRALQQRVQLLEQAKAAQAEWLKPDPIDPLKGKEQASSHQPPSLTHDTPSSQDDQNEGIAEVSETTRSAQQTEAILASLYDVLVRLLSTWEHASSELTGTASTESPNAVRDVLETAFFAAQGQFYNNHEMGEGESRRHTVTVMRQTTTPHDTKTHNTVRTPLLGASHRPHHQQPPLPQRALFVHSDEEALDGARGGAAFPCTPNRGGDHHHVETAMIFPSDGADTLRTPQKNEEECMGEGEEEDIDNFLLYSPLHDEESEGGPGSPVGQKPEREETQREEDPLRQHGVLGPVTGPSLFAPRHRNASQAHLPLATMCPNTPKREKKNEGGDGDLSASPLSARHSAKRTPEKDRCSPAAPLFSTPAAGGASQQRHSSNGREGSSSPRFQRSQVAMESIRHTPLFDGDVEISGTDEHAALRRKGDRWSRSQQREESPAPALPVEKESRMSANARHRRWATAPRSRPSGSSSGEGGSATAEQREQTLPPHTINGSSSVLRNEPVQQPLPLSPMVTPLRHDVGEFGDESPQVAVAGSGAFPPFTLSPSALSIQAGGATTGKRGNDRMTVTRTSSTPRHSSSSPAGGREEEAEGIAVWRAKGKPAVLSGTKLFMTPPNRHQSASPTRTALGGAAASLLQWRPIVLLLQLQWCQQREKEQRLRLYLQEERVVQRLFWDAAAAAVEAASAGHSAKGERRSATTIVASTRNTVIQEKEGADRVKVPKPCVTPASIRAEREKLEGGEEGEGSPASPKTSRPTPAAPSLHRHPLVQVLEWVQEGLRREKNLQQKLKEAELCAPWAAGVSAAAPGSADGRTVVAPRRTTCEDRGCSPLLVKRTGSHGTFLTTTPPRSPDGGTSAEKQREVEGRLREGVGGEGAEHSSENPSSSALSRNGAEKQVQTEDKDIEEVVMDRVGVRRRSDAHTNTDDILALVPTATTVRKGDAITLQGLHLSLQTERARSKCREKEWYDECRRLEKLNSSLHLRCVEKENSLGKLLGGTEPRCTATTEVTTRTMKENKGEVTAMGMREMRDVSSPSPTPPPNVSPAGLLRVPLV